MSSIKLFLVALFLLQALCLDPNCQITTPGGDCMICNDKFFIKNGVCTAFTPHCSSGDVVSGLCNSCQPGFNLVNQACVPGSGSGSDSSITSASLQSLSSSFGSSGSSSAQSSSGSSQFGLPALGTTITNTTTVTTTTSTSSVPFCSIPDQNGGCIACQLGYNLVLNSCIPLQSAQSSQSSQSSQSNQQSTSTSSSSSGQFLNSQFSGIQPLNVVVPTMTSVGDVGGSSSSSQFSQFTTFQPSIVQPLVTNTNTNQNQFSSQFNQFGQDLQNQPTVVQQPLLISPAPSPQPQTTVQTVTTQTTQQASPPIYQPQPQIQPIVNQQSSQFQQSSQQIQQQGLQTQTQAQYRQDPYCASFSPSGSCLRCSNRYYFSNSGACVPISGNCNTYDDRTGACTSCYSTFVLQNGQCYIQVASSSQTDPNCKTYSGNTCRECYQGYIVSSNGLCTVGNMLCRTSDNFGNCLSCYPGYSLLNNNCTVTVNSFANPNCANFSNGVCVRCSQGYYMRAGNCVQVNPLCNTFDQNNGNCLSCYKGYNLVSGNCVIATQSSAAMNCRNFTNGICVQCSNRYFNLNGICTPVNDYCNTYNENNGNCTSCYQGFVLQQGACYRVLVTGPQQPNPNQGGFQPNTGYVFAQDSNPGSLSASNLGGSYTTTTTTTTYSSDGSTVPCLQFDTQGKCISCSRGFNLNNGICIQIS